MDETGPDQDRKEVLRDFTATYISSGTLSITVPRERWWQFWLPMEVTFGHWQQVGRVVVLALPDRIVNYMIDQEIRR